MKAATLIARIFLGIFLIFNGINMWFPMLPVQVPDSEKAVVLMHGLVFSGLFSFVKFVEIAVGVMLVVNRMVPFGLLIMMPLTVVIAYIDFVLIGSKNAVIFGLLLVVPHVFLMLVYLRYYLPILAVRAKAEPATAADVSKAFAGEL